MVAAKLPQSRLQSKDVVLTTHKRHPDQVCVSNDKLKVFEILRRECRQVDVRIGKIYSFVGAEAVSVWLWLGNLDEQYVGRDLF